MIIAVDFDGTCVTHDFPKIGKEIGAAEALKELTNAGHQIILWTMRSDNEVVTTQDSNIHPKPGKYLSEAIDWFKKHDIPLYGIQCNPTQKDWTSSPKAYAELYIDDAALGCPLKYDPDFHPRPYVDWATVSAIVMQDYQI